MHRRLFALTALAALAVLPACSNDTAPDPTEGKTHPAGTVSMSDRISFGAGLIGIAVDPSGVGYVTTGLGTLGRFSTQSPYTKLSSLTTGPSPRDLVIDHAGTTAYASTDKGTAYAVDLKTGTMKATLAVDTLYHSGNAQDNLLALSPDGSRAYLLTDGRLWSLPTNGGAATASSSSGSGVAVSPTTGSIFLTNTDGGKTARLDPSTLAVQAETSAPIWGGPLAVAPRGDEVYVGGYYGDLHVLDPTTLALRATVNVGNYEISGVAVSPDGKQIYVALFDSRVAIVDRAARTVVSTVTLSGSPLGVAFDPTGSTAFVVNWEGYVDVIR